MSADSSTCSGGYELRFAGLFNPGRGYAFPCDACGNVDLDSLGELAKTNYLYARTVIGRELRAPVMCAVALLARRAESEGDSPKRDL